MHIQLPELILVDSFISIIHRLFFEETLQWGLLKLTQINLPMHIQLPGIDFYKQLSSYYPSFAFWRDITWSSLKLTQINLLYSIT